MKYEHLVIINDADTPALLQLSPEQVWYGLLHRAEDPRPFLPGLESCTLRAREGNVLRRTLHFPGIDIDDEVHLEEGRAIRILTRATPQHPGGTLTITIEQPAAGVLALRFAYATTLADDSNDPDGAYACFIEAAYHASDIDTVRVIRELARADSDADCAPLN